MPQYTAASRHKPPSLNCLNYSQSQSTSIYSQFKSHICVPMPQYTAASRLKPPSLNRLKLTSIYSQFKSHICVPMPLYTAASRHKPPSLNCLDYSQSQSTSIYSQFKSHICVPMPNTLQRQGTNHHPWDIKLFTISIHVHLLTI
jgi:hypothetical protein